RAAGAHRGRAALGRGHGLGDRGQHARGPQPQPVVLAAPPELQLCGAEPAGHRPGLPAGAVRLRRGPRGAARAPARPAVQRVHLRLAAPLDGPGKASGLRADRPPQAAPADL
ncbi:unnamed protein product, partial [Prorocentrum cordatum]